MQVHGCMLSRHFRTKYIGGFLLLMAMINQHFLQTQNLNRAWISNHTPNKVYDQINCASQTPTAAP